MPSAEWLRLLLGAIACHRPNFLTSKKESASCRKNCYLVNTHDERELTERAITKIKAPGPSPVSTAADNARSAK